MPGSRPHWSFRGPELMEGCVPLVAFVFQKGRLGVCVHRTHLFMCLPFFYSSGKQYCQSRSVGPVGKLATVRQSGYGAGLVPVV